MDIFGQYQDQVQAMEDLNHLIGLIGIILYIKECLEDGTSNGNNIRY